MMLHVHVLSTCDSLIYIFPLIHNIKPTLPGVWKMVTDFQTKSTEGERIKRVQGHTLPGKVLDFNSQKSSFGGFWVILQ